MQENTVNYVLLSLVSFLYILQTVAVAMHFSCVEMICVFYRIFLCNVLTSTCPHLTCDVGLEY